MRHKLVVSMLLFCGAGFSQSADLERGGTEVRGFGGLAADSSNVFGDPKFSAGVEAAMGLNRYVALTGHYALDQIGRSGCSFFAPCTPFENEKMHEFMAGLRLSVPNHSRVTPYAAGTIGAVRLVNFGSSVSNPSTQFGVGVGIGLNIRIRHRIGVTLDVHTVHAVSTEIWVIRPTAGFYYRF
jgi:opacity protein-like surface antigen